MGGGDFKSVGNHCEAKTFDPSAIMGGGDFKSVGNYWGAASKPGGFQPPS
jgi:hypothetical protein